MTKKKPSLAVNPNWGRRGKMLIAEPLVKSADFPALLAAAQFVPLRVEYQYALNRFEYIGASPLFRELEQSEITPTYSLHFKKSDEGGLEICGVYEE